MLGRPLYPIPSALVCASLDEPEPVDSVLTFLSGYDTLEYLFDSIRLVWPYDPLTKKISSMDI